MKYTNHLIQNIGLIVKIVNMNLNVLFLTYKKEIVHIAVNLRKNYVMTINVKDVLKNLLRLMKNQFVGVLKMLIIVEILLLQDKFSNHLVKNFGLNVIIVLMNLKVH